MIAVTLASASLVITALAAQIEQQPHDLVSVRYESERLAAQVAAEDAAVRSNGRFSQLQLSLVNTTGRSRTIEYKVDWLDIDGFEVGAVSAWHVMTLSGNARERIQSAGQSSEAVSAAVSIRTPQN